MFMFEGLGWRSSPSRWLSLWRRQTEVDRAALASSKKGKGKRTIAEPKQVKTGDVCGEEGTLDVAKALIGGPSASSTSTADAEIEVDERAHMLKDGLHVKYDLDVLDRRPRLAVLSIMLALPLAKTQRLKLRELPSRAQRKGREGELSGNRSKRKRETSMGEEGTLDVAKASVGGPSADAKIEVDDRAGMLKDGLHVRVSIYCS